MRIGLLGGSFNPVHTGHLRLAIEVREALGLDRVELVVAGEPPHKETRAVLPFVLRFELARLAVRGEPGLEANPVESEREGPSYTWDTLEILKRKRPEHDFVFILGMESFMGFESWHRGLEFPANFNLAVADRAGRGPRHALEFAGVHWPEAEVGAGEPTLMRFPSGTGTTFVPVPRLDISATDIRERWLNGRSIRWLVPGAVEEALEAMRSDVQRIWSEKN